MSSGLDVPASASPRTSHHPACLRWMVNINRWHPSGEHDGPEFTFLLSLLPEHEREEVQRFRYMDDKKRALCSRLMQRIACAKVTNMGHNEIVLKRTKGRKPFLAWREMNGFVEDAVGKQSETKQFLQHAPNFNFNVSHEGDFVVLVSEPVSIVGVDVAAPGQVRRKNNRDGKVPSVAEMLDTFSNVLSSSEKQAIEHTGRIESDQAAEDLFRRHWSCKEALTKAMGVGLALDLASASFSFRALNESNESFEAFVSIDSVPKTKWRFRTEKVHGLDDDKNNDGSDTNPTHHWITTARGPSEDVVDAHGVFSQTWRLPGAGNSDDAFWQSIVNAPAPPFSNLTIGDLVPEELKHLFEQAGGEVW